MEVMLSHIDISMTNDKLMLGGKHSSNHCSTIWKEGGSDKLFGTGLVNRIQTQVDATSENGTNPFYYLRGYWTPYQDLSAYGYFR